MKIIADENIPLVEAFFGELGEIQRLPGRTMTVEQVKDADVLLVRSVTSVNQQLLEGSRVRFVGTCTIGIDHLETEWLTAQGIGYSSAPGCNANSVVEYVFSALSALDIPWWQQSVGIIGCGNVGGSLYRRLTSLGVDCSVYDPLLASGSIRDLTDLEQVLQADIICSHAPLTRTGDFPSYHLLNEHNLKLIKPDATLISAGRGAVIDNQALLNLLEPEKSLNVVLDVWEPEPALNPELLQRVDLGSPHIAGYSFDGKVAGTAMIYRALCKQLALDAADQTGVPSAQELIIDLTDEAGSAEQLLQAAILGAYDIRKDDHRLRDMVDAGADIGEGFDQLRKQYPTRREFSQWTVRLTQSQADAEMTFGTGNGAEKKPLNNVLAAMGFICNRAIPRLEERE